MEHSARHAKYLAMTTTGFAVSCIMAFMFLGAPGLIVSAFFAPVLFAQIARPAAPANLPDLPEPALSRPKIMGHLSRFLGEVGHPTVALIAEVDDFDRLQEVYGVAALEGALEFTHQTISSHLTERDETVHLDGARFVAALAPQSPHELETMLNTCTRIQHSMSQAPMLTDLPVPLTVSIGFAASHKVEDASADALLQAAFAALADARRNGPNAVRGHSKSMADRRIADQRVALEARHALERGEIFAYFQPQISIADGTLSGFEALTRWHHPDRGIISPADFLPALEQAGLMQQLSDIMVKQAIRAMTFWDKAGMEVPRIGVNFASNELRNPHLVSRIASHLDTAGIAPDRLIVEVLETVIAGDASDEIVGNLAALADLGCGIDLDDFGTGYASITNIRRFSVGRIKIDRSFVTGIDDDPEQRNMVMAILTMAKRLGVDTLAEGVETRGERDTLRDLGCVDAQGFQFARPMPLEETVDWAAAYFERHADPMILSQRAS